MRILGSLEERYLGNGSLGEVSRADYADELAAVPERNADLAHTFPKGAAFHHSSEDAQ